MADNNKVVVAMSGGVDSSVAAALLVEQGYDVTGMMLRLWSETGQDDENRCCSIDSMHQARRVAGKLGIRFYVLDAKEVFYDSVVNYFIDELANGFTPNPCLVCNRVIRWDFLLKKAISTGANFLATGHYVQKVQDKAGLYQIRQAVDPIKDQSYVLYSMNQEKLAHALFPIGDYTKPQIRQIAHELGLSVAARPDSQDLCFLGSSDYQSFLMRNAPHLVNPGPILTNKGEKVGQHQGLAFYTIGQRKGLGIPSSKPLYVMEKILPTNTLVVAPLECLGKKILFAKHVNWISGKQPEKMFQAKIKIRYKATPVNGTVIPLENQQVQMIFDTPLRDITAGQAAVIYDGDICLGGGIIYASKV